MNIGTQKLFGYANCCDKAQKICGNRQLCMIQENYLKTDISWNGYPHYIRTKIIKQLQSQQKGK